MDTKKAYRMLIVVLFFAFVSLISRSIIYLVLSVAIATMIIFLLSSAKKVKNGTSQQGRKQQSNDQNVALHKFLLVTTVIGGLIIGYGSLYLPRIRFFQQFITVPEQYYIAILIIIAGFTIVLFSLYFILREMLFSNKTKTKTATHVVTVVQKIKQIIGIAQAVENSCCKNTFGVFFF
nr:hypothetical protein [Anaerobacillus sp. CMMVII]